MPKYKLVEMTDLRNTGKRRVYPKMVVNRTLSQSEFIDKMKMYSRALPSSMKKLRWRMCAICSCVCFPWVTM